MIRKNAYIAAAALCIAGSFGLASSALAEKGYTYEVDIHTAAEGASAEDTTTYICMGDSDLQSPPKALTGAQCPAPTFSREEDTLKWSGTCEQTQENGTWTFSHNDKSFEGEGIVRSSTGLTSTKVEGHAIDKCTV